jgi:hypothetical protein
MKKQTYSLPADTTLVLTACGGQIDLVGGKQSDVILKGPRAPEAKEAEGTLEMGPLHGTYKVTVPKEAPVTVREASGDLAIKRSAGNVVVEAVHGTLALRDLESITVVRQAHGQVEGRDLTTLRLAGACHGDVRLRRIGDLDIQQVHGDVTLSRVGQAARIVQVNGDLRVDRVEGPLSIDEVDGDLRVRRVTGQLFVNEVSNDLMASRLSGGASVEEVAGDIVASVDPAPGQEYRFRAYGDIVLKVPPTAHVHLTVEAPAGGIRNDLALDIEEENPHRLVGVMNPPAPPAEEAAAEPLPEPATVILVSAGGNVRLRPSLDWGQEMGRWGEQFGQEMGQWGEQFGQEMGQWGEQFGQEMGRLSEEIGREIAGAFEGVDTERISEHVTGRVAEAQVQLEHRLHEIDVDDLVRKAEAAATAGITWAQEAVTRALSYLEQEGRISHDVTPPEDDTSRQEEKLAILKMIETGRITAAEGEMLLDALEG